MRLFFLLFLIGLSGKCIRAQADNPLTEGFITNGDIKAMLVDDGILYLGGSFSYIGGKASYGIAVDASTGEVNSAYLQPDNTVNVVIPDGSGGWYIGGSFTSVGGQTRNRLARINSDGTLNDWNPNLTGGQVFALALSGSTLYVGGNFTTSFRIGGQARGRIAALDITTGLATDWNPNADNVVKAILIDGSTIYVGGDFSNIGGQARNRIASLDPALNTNNANSWNPAANSTVNTLAIDAGVVYAGGNFTNIGGQSRNRIAALDASTGAASSWNPGSSGTVRTLIINSGIVYAGGDFTTIGGQSRSRIAAVDASTGTATSWNPAANDFVNALYLNGGAIYAAGNFTNIGGQSRSKLASIDVATGLATSWDPGSSDEVKTFAFNSGTVYAGGTFVGMGGQVRNKLAAVDLGTGEITVWNPNADGDIWAMGINGGTLYVGGSFSNIGGTSRNRIAAINTGDGILTDWNPNANNQIRALAVSGNTVFVGGLFSTVGGLSRAGIAALDATVNTNNALASWNPGTDDLVRALAVSGSSLYVGGDFTTIGGQTRFNLASLNVTDGSVNPWNPNPDGNVMSLAVNGGTVYAGGDFSTFNATVSRSRVAGIDAITGSPTDWNPASNGTVYAFAFSGSAIYLGGSFTNIGGQNRNRIAAVNRSTGAPFLWNPNSGGTIYSISVFEDGTYIGGSFSTMGDQELRNLAAFPNTTIEWGGASGSWNLADNWAPGIVPTTSMDVRIASGNPQMNVDYTVNNGNSLTISGTGSLTIVSGQSLTVAGTADFGGKSVLFKSDATGTARLGQVTGTLSGATNVTVERYLPAGRKWRFLAAPLTGASNNSVFYNWQNNDVPNGNTGVEIWGPGGSADPSNGNTGLAIGPNPSMRSYNAGWQGVTNTNSTYLFDGTTNYGFALFQTGPYNNGSTAYIGGPGNLPAGIATTLSATGELISGTHTKTMTASTPGELFLVANPYASPYNPASFTDAGTVNRTNIDNTLYMWDAKPGGTNGLGRYVSYSISAGEYSNGGAGTGYPNNSVLIQSGQSFFARATASGASTLVFREENKGSLTTLDMMGNTQETSKPSLRFQLWQDTINLDGAVAIFQKKASRGIDPMDGIKLLNGSENLGFRRDGKTLVFEFHPEPTVTDTLFLHLGQMRQQSYRLRVDAQSLNIPSGMELQVVDRFTKQELKPDPKGVTEVDFSVTADSASSGERFIVVLSGKPGSGVITPEPAGEIPLKVYPNPIVGLNKAHVALDASKAPWNVRVVDAMGRMMWEKPAAGAASGVVEIDLSNLGVGVYQLVATDVKGNRIVTSFIRQ